MFSGKIQYINAREFNGKTLHSFKLAGETPYFGTGETPVAAVKGDMVEFNGKVDAKGNVTVDLSSFVNKGAAGSAPVSVIRGTKQGGASFATKAAGKDQFWENKELRDIATQKIIQLQASRNSAISLASLLLQADAIPGYKKAKENEKMDVVTSLVDHLTDRFQDQVAGTRTATEQPEVEETVTMKEDDDKWS